MDLGIIACVKRLYKQKVAELAINLIDDGQSANLDNVDMRIAASWVYEIWNRLNNDVIYNC